MFDASIAFILAAGIGLVSSLIGMGGGFLFVPTLTMAFSFSQKAAVGTSLAVMIFSSAAASLVYWRQHKVLITLAAFLVGPAMIASLLGSLVTALIDARILTILFVIVLILTSLQMLVPSLSFVPAISVGPSLTVDLHGSGAPLRVPCLHLVVWGALGGLVSGVTGTSGGLLFVPALVVAGVPVHYAVATSLLTIIPTSITGATAQAFQGNVSLPYLLIFGTGAIIGAYAGASLSRRVHADHIKQVFGLLLMGVAFLMIQQRFLGG